MNEYKLITGRQENFEDALNDYINSGWIISGNLTSVFNKETNYIHYAQLVERIVPKDK